MVPLAVDDKAQAPGKDNTSSTISFLKFRYGLQNFFAAMKTLKVAGEPLKTVIRERSFQSHSLADDSYSLEPYSHKVEMNEMQKHKNMEVAHSEAYSAIQSELRTAKETHRKLESVVSDLRCETSFKDNEIKHLRQEVKALIDARNELIKELKFSNYSLERKLQQKTHELAILMEKHERHSSLLEAIENEAYLVRQVVDETNACIKEKEEAVIEFKRSISKVLGFEDALLGKISQMEQEIADSLTRLSERNAKIMELEEKISAESAQQNIETDLAICKANLELKGNFISKLKQEKEVLLEDMKNFEYMTGKLQMAIAHQDKTILEYQQRVQDLERNVTTLTETLTKTEKKLSLAADCNDKLLKSLEEQKSEFGIQAQAWEAKLQAYKEKICGLEARVATCEESHIGTCPSADVKGSGELQLAKDEEGELILSETLRNSSSEFSVETLTIFYDAEKDNVSASYFSDIESLEESLFPAQIESKETRLGVSASKIHDGSSLENLDLKKNDRSYNISSILERLGRPINMFKMKRKATPTPFGVHKLTRPLLVETPRLKFGDLSNVVLGINFGISEFNPNRRQNFRVVHEIDERDGEECLGYEKQEGEVEKDNSFNMKEKTEDICILVAAPAENEQT